MTAVTVEIHDEVFNEVYVPFLNAQQRIQILFGGSSSGKSRFSAQRCIEDLLGGGRNYLVTRAVGNTLRSSVFNELQQVIDAYGVQGLFKINKSEMTITCVNEYQIILKGLDDPEKIKSIVPRRGVITDIWIEEATEISEDSFNNLRKRLRGEVAEGITKRILLTFNPILRTHWIFKRWFQDWADDEVLRETHDLLILKTTYIDNAFITQDDIDDLLKEKNKYYRDVYTHGKWGVLGDVIFENWQIKDILNDPIRKTFDIHRHGLDFGFSNDPTAYNQMYYHRATRTLYIFGEWAALGVTNDEIAAELKPGLNGDYLVCDSAEPKSIAELNNHGCSAIGAQKGKDSVNHGIQWLQQQNIIIDKRLINTINNFTQYQWQKDKDGNSLNKPVDKFNDHIDAIRYALEDLMLLDENTEIVTGISTANQADW